MMMQVDEIKLVVSILHSYRELSPVIVICCVVDMGLWGVTTPLPYAANGDMTNKH